MKKKTIKTRDYAMVAIIKGATKAGAHKDRKKEASKKHCRRRVRQERKPAQRP